MNFYLCRLNSVYFPLSLQLFVFYLGTFFFCVHQMDLRYAFDLQTFLYIYMTLVIEFLLLLLPRISFIVIVTIPILYSISIVANIIIITTDSLLLFHRTSSFNYSETYLLKSHFSIAVNSKKIFHRNTSRELLLNIFIFTFLFLHFYIYIFSLFYFYCFF